MADAVADLCSEKGVVCIRNFFDKENHDSVNVNDSVAIYFGSGRELPRLIEFSRCSKIPIIQGSSYPDAIKHMNEAKGVAIVHAPNLSIPVVKFMALFREQAKVLSDFMELSILESHQKGKKDVSKTAREIADMIDLDHDCIESIRDPEEQIEFLGVPKEHLDGHAYHFFNFEGMGVKIQTSIMIHGRKTYALGALLLAKALLARSILLDFEDGPVKFVDISDAFYLKGV
ncbi:MAG: dihydrodipicolinate reductase C-terminal domain-containing protein [Bacteriovoracia bacterium]